MTEPLQGGIIADELLRDDADCPVFGFNLACAYPFPGAAAKFYRPIASRLAALAPGVYVYPEWETHVTIITFVNFSLHRRPNASQLAHLQSLVTPVIELLRPLLCGRSFPLQFGAPVLTPKAAILPIKDPEGEIACIRQNVGAALKADEKLGSQLSKAGLNVPGIVHSTVMRFKSPPVDLSQFTAGFAEAFALVQPVEIMIDELLLATETKPYMREGSVACRFPLAAI